MSHTLYDNLLQKYMSTTKALNKKASSKDKLKIKNAILLNANASKIANPQKMARNSFFNNGLNLTQTTTTKTESNLASLIKTPVSQHGNESIKELPKKIQHNTTQHIIDENISPLSQGLKIKKSTPIVPKKTAKQETLQHKIIHLQSIYNTHNHEDQKKLLNAHQKLNCYFKNKELNLTSRGDTNLMGTIKIPIKMNQNITLNINGDVSTINISTNKNKDKDHSLEPGIQTTRARPKEYSFLKPSLIKLPIRKEVSLKHSESIRHNDSTSKDTKEANSKAVTKQIIEDFTKLKSIKLLADPPVSTRNERALNFKTEIMPVMPSTSRNNAVSITKSFMECGMTPSQAIAGLRDNLLEYEEKEVLQFPRVYYVGIKKHKIVPNPKQPNNGWDDNKEFYIVNSQDHLAYRYEIVKLIGKGSFGCVYKCIDHKANVQCAVKILRNKEKFHTQGQIEVSLLKSLNQGDGSQYFVKLLDSFTFRNHICIVCEMLSIDLYELLKASKFAGFTLNLIKVFTKQLLFALKHMKKMRIIHCDLKPENILLSNPNNTSIRVIDLGTGCFENKTVYTYIQSRFYRAPEIMMGIPYTCAIDMWSIGCIILELHLGCPIFAGEDETEQIAMIMEYRGVPSAKVILKGSRSKNFFDFDFQPICITNTKGVMRKPKSKSLESILEDKQFADFVCKCLEWDSDKRMTPEQGLAHPWLN